ncbi:MAG: acyltransferase [Sphingobium sp.]|nr:acyltransferase [Sphingobium sp.]
MVDPQRWSSSSLTTLGLQYTLLNGFGGEVGWNTPTWSISTEAVAYALFPLMALGGRWPYLAAAAAFYLWIAATTGVLDIVSGVAILRCLAGFSIGMAICAGRDRIASSKYLSAAQLTGLLLALTAIATGWNDVFAIPGFILLVAATWPDKGALCVPLKWPLLVWLGEVSYSVYLNHFWVLESWHVVAPRVLPRLGFDPYATRAIEMTIGLAAVLLVSHVTWRLIERPAQKYLRNQWGVKPAPVGANPAP